MRVAGRARADTTHIYLAQIGHFHCQIKLVGIAHAILFVFDILIHFDFFSLWQADTAIFQFPDVETVSLNYN